MMKIRKHVNFTLEEITSDEMLHNVSSEGLVPELFIDGNEIEDLREGDMNNLKSSLESRGLLPITIHAPFRDLSPGSPDESIWKLSMGKISKAVAIGSQIPVSGVVVHSGYNDWYFDYDKGEWLNRAVPFFSELCERAKEVGTQIFVENIFEAEPESLMQLEKEVASDRLKFCFDPGHASLFSPLPLVSWVKALGTSIAEVHLHDNCGKRDEHLPLLEGIINFRGILHALRDLELNPILTLEPHTVDHALRTVRNLAKLIDEVYGDSYRGNA